MVCLIKCRSWDTKETWARYRASSRSNRACKSASIEIFFTAPPARRLQGRKVRIWYLPFGHTSAGTYERSVAKRRTCLMGVTAKFLSGLVARYTMSIPIYLHDVGHMKGRTNGAVVYQIRSDATPTRNGRIRAWFLPRIYNTWTWEGNYHADLETLFYGLIIISCTFALRRIGSPKLLLLCWFRIGGFWKSFFGGYCSNKEHFTAVIVSSTSWCKFGLRTSTLLQKSKCCPSGTINV